MKWTKFTERECDLFTAYCILTGYTNLFCEHIGVNFNYFLIINKKGIIHSYRESNEFNKILQIIKGRKGKLLEILDKLEEKNKELLKFLDCNFNGLSDKELVFLFKKFMAVYQQYFPLFTMPKYYGMVFENRDFSNEVENKIKKLRGTAYYENIQDKFLPLFFNEISFRTKIEGELLFNALPKEIIDLLENKRNINNSLLHQRKNYCLFFVKKSNFNLYVGDRAKKIATQEIKMDKINASKIKGTVTFQAGIIKGRVKLVKYKKDLQDLADKILVTPMTSIRFIPYIKKVKAIITDEGGLACHAAIISRELKKPCIVGTTIASNILKDNDIVEINTYNGIIKLIK